MEVRKSEKEGESDGERESIDVFFFFFFLLLFFFFFFIDPATAPASAACLLARTSPPYPSPFLLRCSQAKSTNKILQK